jgi:hypothetical protein
MHQTAELTTHHVAFKYSDKEKSPQTSGHKTFKISIKG